MGASWIYVLLAVLIIGRMPLRSNPPVALASFDLIFLLSAGVGIAFSIRAARHPGLAAPVRRPWRFMAAFFALHLLGGALITFSLGPDLTQIKISIPLLVGLVGRVVQVGVLLASLLSFVSARMDARARWKLAMDVLTVLGAASMLLWYGLVGPVLTHRGPDLSAGTVLYSVVMSLCDLVSIVGTCAVLLRGTLPPASRPLKALLIGIGGYLLADLWFLFLQMRGDTRPTTATGELLLLLPLVFMAAAAIEQCRLAGEPDPPAWGRYWSRAPAWLPYLALVIGYGVLLVAAIRAGQPWSGLVLAGLVMTVGVAARQFVALQENLVLVGTDDLTGIANRLQLRAAMARAVGNSRRGGTPMAVLAIDLNGFKKINDLYGHEAGDELLVAFARLLRRNVREVDTPARLGGDEFVAVLDGVPHSGVAVAVAERILVEARRPVVIKGQPITMRASIGIALNDPAAPDDADDLLRRADRAMYAAKRQLTHGWRLHTSGSESEEADHIGLSEDLLRAVDAGELRVHYQPIVALGSGELIAVEALVRWCHPTRGLLPPASFIPLAEQVGLVHDIDMWVLDRASHQVRRWQARLSPERELCLSVNVSATQLERRSLGAEMLEVLHRNDFRPANLVVELTESAAVDDRLAPGQLAVLREHGVRVALDDFGTGYSSLRYLSRLPVDILKLDRGFVAGIGADPVRSAIVRSVIDLGQDLRLDTVAEGVEDASQAAELALLGCGNGQGHHFARPLPADGLEALIDGFGQRWPRLPVATLPEAAMGY